MSYCGDNKVVTCITMVYFVMILNAAAVIGEVLTVIDKFNLIKSKLLM